MVTILIRFFPARRIYQVVTLIGGIFLAGFDDCRSDDASGTFMNPKDTDDFVKLIRDMTFPIFESLPKFMGRRNRDSWRFFKIDASLLAFTPGTIVVLAIVQNVFYQSAYVHSQESQALKAQRTSGKTFRKQ